MRVLFVTPFDPRNPDAWAGTQQSMLGSLRSACEVSVLYVRPPAWIRAGRRLFGRLFPRAATRDYGRSQFAVRVQAKKIARALKESPVDLVFSPSSVPLSLYTGDVQSVFWTDAVYPQLVGFYAGEFARVEPSTLARATAQERGALKRSRSVYSSNWAADAARRLSPGVSPLVLGFGPNMTSESIERIRSVRESRAASETVTLLWIGGEWERKGGPIAVELIRLLRQRGINAQLDVVGAIPPTLDDSIKAHGRLSKSDPNDLRRLEELFATADLLVLPSVADCTPIVVSEAAAVGLPVIATNVGGLGETIRRFDMGIVHELDDSFARNVADDLETALADLDAFPAWRASALRAAAWLSWDASFREILAIAVQPSPASDLLSRGDFS